MLIASFCLILVEPESSRAQAPSTYVLPVQLWVDQAVLDQYGGPLLWSLINDSFVQASLVLRQDWDGPSGPRDVPCDVEIVRDWADVYTAYGQPPPEYTFVPEAQQLLIPGDCHQPSGTQPMFLPTFPLSRSRRGPGECSWDVFFQPLVSPFSFGSMRNFYLRYNGNSAPHMGWTIAHEAVHAADNSIDGTLKSHSGWMGGTVIPTGCHLMQTPQDTLWSACIPAVMSTEQLVQSLTQEICDTLLREPFVVLRKYWERQRFDFTGNGAVSAFDKTFVADEINEIISGTNPFDRRYDFNFDHVIDQSDITGWHSAIDSFIATTSQTFDSDADGVPDVKDVCNGPNNFKGIGNDLATLGPSTYAQDYDNDGIPTCKDACPFSEVTGITSTQQDTNGDGRGDHCQCGDANLSGGVTVDDIIQINVCIFQPPWAPLQPGQTVHPCPWEKAVLADADGNVAVNIADIVATNTEIFSPGETATCSLSPHAEP